LIYTQALAALAAREDAARAAEELEAAEANGAPATTTVKPAFQELEVLLDEALAETTVPARCCVEGWPISGAARLGARRRTASGAAPSTLERHRSPSREWRERSSSSNQLSPTAQATADLGASGAADEGPPPRGEPFEDQENRATAMKEAHGQTAARAAAARAAELEAAGAANGAPAISTVKTALQEPAAEPGEAPTETAEPARCGV